MRYPAAETAEKHQRILVEATRLFRDRGFESVSIPEIMKAAGLTHGSFYNHFESKNDLMSECVMHGAANSLAAMLAVPPTAEGKSAYIDNYLSLRHRDDPGSGCLMSALGSETRRQPLAQSAMTRFVQAFVDRIGGHFPSGRKAKARREAIRLTASLVGGLILARAVDDEAFSQEILKEVRDGLRKKGRPGDEV